MSVMHSPRTPWIMLALFCCAALMLFFLTIGNDAGRLRDVTRADEIAAVKKEVRMPIVFEEKSIAPKAQPSSGPSENKPMPIEKHAAGPPSQPSEELLSRPSSEARDSTPALPGKLLSHSFSQTGSTFEAAFRTNKPVAGAKIFFKSPPALWAVDLPGQWTNYAPRVTDFDSGPVAQVVIGRHTDFLRVVFRYRDKNHPKPGSMPEIIEEQEGGFRITIPGE